jgi:hypothetical protein
VDGVREGWRVSSRGAAISYTYAGLCVHSPNDVGLRLLDAQEGDAMIIAVLASGYLPNCRGAA